MLQRNPDIGHRKASYPSGLFLYLVFGVMSRYGRTNRRPGLCYPAKDQRELAAECRRLKSMLVPDKRSLPEISSRAHVTALREGCVKQPDSLICARTETGFYGDPLLPNQATF